MRIKNYTQFINEAKEFKKDYLTLYADAGFKDGKGTWGIWIRADYGRLVLNGKCPEEIQDNSIAEIYAICQGMHKGLKKWPGTKGFHIKTDSQTAINVLTNKSGGFAKRNEVVARLKKAYDKMVNDYNLHMSIKWVKGHKNKNTNMSAWLNNRVDNLATDARNEK